MIGFLVYSKYEQFKIKCSRSSSPQPHSWHVGFTTVLLYADLFDWSVYAPHRNLSFVDILLTSLVECGSICSNLWTSPGWYLFRLMYFRDLYRIAWALIISFQCSFTTLFTLFFHCCFGNGLLISSSILPKSYFHRTFLTSMKQLLELIDLTLDCLTANCFSMEFSGWWHTLLKNVNFFLCIWASTGNSPDKM